MTVESQRFIEQLIESIDLQRLQGWQIQKLVDACVDEQRRRADLAADPFARGIARQENRRRARLSGKW